MDKCWNIFICRVNIHPFGSLEHFHSADIRLASSMIWTVLSIIGDGGLEEFFCKEDDIPEEDFV